MKGSVLLSPTFCVRGIAAVVTLLGVWVCANSVGLAALMGGGLVPLLLAQGQIRKFSRIVARVFGPTAVALTAVWALCQLYPDSEGFSRLPHARWDYVSIVLLRLLCTTGLVYAVFLGLPAGDLPKLLAEWHVPSGIRQTVAGAIALMPELARRVDQLVAARYARGLATNRSVFSRAMQFPFVLKSLFVWSVINGFERLEVWDREYLLIRAVDARGSDVEGMTQGFMRPANWFWITMSIGWFGYALWT